MRRFSVITAAGLIGLGAAISLPASKANAATWQIDYLTPSNGVETKLTVTTDTSSVAGLNFNNAAGLAVQNGGLYVGGQFIPVTQLQGYSILSISGTRTDSTGTIQMYGSSGYLSSGNIAVQHVNNYIYDNVTYNTNGLPVVDVLGLEYQLTSGSASNLFNFYSTANTGSGQAGYMENLIPAVLLSLTVEQTVPTGSQVSAVPLPAALPLFGAALIGLGALARRRAKAVA